MSVPSLTRFKRCTNCRCWKPATETFFGRCSRKVDGLRERCKVCRRLDYRAKRLDPAYVAAERERKRALETARRESGKIPLRADNGAWAAYMRDWRARNPDKARLASNEAVRRFNERHPEARANQRRNRRALLRAAEGTHTAEEVQQMVADQGGLCAYCEAPILGTFDVDHMVPLSRGGRNDWANIAVACPDCNRRKHDKTAEEFMALVS